MKPENEEQMADGHAVASGGDERDNTNAPQFLEEVVEMQRLAPHEQELQLTAVHLFREWHGDVDDVLQCAT